jgi:hypothetical protein
MKVDAIYLLAPKPKPPSGPTRRAFLIAGGTLVVGALAGGSCGYSMGLAARPSDKPEPKGDKPEPKAQDATAPKVEEELKPSGDAELDYWRQVAVKAPLDELFEKGVMFLGVRVRDYPKDQILWRGVERMVRELDANASRAVDETVLMLLPAQIEGQARPAEPSLREFAPALRSRRQDARKNQKR